MTFVLSGCGFGAEGSQKSTETNMETTEAAASEAEQAISDYEKKYAAGEFTAQEYLALSDLYAESGQIKKQRDMLEESYRLFGDEETFNRLQNIAVNLEEEDSLAKAEAERLVQNLTIPEYQNEAVGMLISEDWQKVMMPKLLEGRRNYYLEDIQQDAILYLEVGFDEKGVLTTNAWYVTGGSEVIYLSQSKDMAQLMITGLSQGSYHGAFSSWLCLADAGDVYYENGTFETGVLTGDYTAQVHCGTERVDLFALWNTRGDVEPVTYTGNFDTGGMTALEQPAAAQRQVTSGGNGEENYIVYAYNDDHTKYLFINAGEDAAADSYVFDYRIFGLAEYPEFVMYEPVTAAEAGSTDLDMKVRIYDNNIEYFDGSRWHVLGTVEEFQAADPFTRYASGGWQEAAGESGDDTGTAATGRYADRGTGSVVTESKTNNNSTNKPSNNNNQVTTPSTPAEAPSTTPDNGSNNNGDSGGADTDIGWSEDIM